MIIGLLAFAVLDALFWLTQGLLLRAEGRATVSAQAMRAAAVHPRRTRPDRVRHSHRRSHWQFARAAPTW
jgi:hypothetical protein